MRFLLAGGVLLMVLPAMADDAKKDEVKGDLKAIQGNWEAISITSNGRPTNPPPALGKFIVEVKGDTISFNLRGMSQPMFKVKAVRAEKTPREFDFEFLRGGEKGKTLKVIYELKDKSFKFCAPKKAMADRPTKFDASKGSNNILFELRPEAKG